MLEAGGDLLSPDERGRADRTGLHPCLRRRRLLAAGAEWLASIDQWRVGYNRHDSDSQSWSLGLEWSDGLNDGNSIGMGVGQPVIASTIDDGLVWEWWTSWPISDSISVTPALFLLTRPLGDASPSQRTVQQLRALVKTSFRF